MAKTRKLSSGMKAWNVHWKKVRTEMEKKGTFKKGDSLMKVFEEAKKSYKHHKKGGADEEPSTPTPVPSPDMTKPIPGAEPAPESEPSSKGGRARKTRRRGGRKH
jgi:hypothetical protein